jgi:hypothetical protein
MTGKEAIQHPLMLSPVRVISKVTEVQLAAREDESKLRKRPVTLGLNDTPCMQMLRSYEPFLGKGTSAPWQALQSVGVGL